jgi:hypothetical protein
MTEFLSKNADEALVQVKEKLYERLEGLRDYIAKMAEWGYAPDATEHQIINEIQFLEYVLDMIERS